MDRAGQHVALSRARAADRVVLGTELDVDTGEAERSSRIPVRLETEQVALDGVRVRALVLDANTGRWRARDHVAVGRVRRADAVVVGTADHRDAGAALLAVGRLEGRAGVAADEVSDDDVPRGVRTAQLEVVEHVVDRQATEDIVR